MVSYKKAGVDVNKGDEFVEIIKKSSKLVGGIGQGLFGSVFDVKKLGYADPLLISGTDGVGTKLKIAQRLGKHDTIGIDLVAMCVNDVLCHGAKPLFFLDYIATGSLDLDISTSIINGVIEGCKIAGCDLVGGETAEMPGIYKEKDYDLAGFCVGAVERKDLLPRSQDIRAGDVLIGLPSNGVHSNGFSLINYILDSLKETSKELLKKLLIPTKIYVKDVINHINTLKALAHITGGGLYNNTMRIIPDGLNIEIDYDAIPKLEIFDWIRKAGEVPEDEMRKTFNIGVGMVVVVDKNNVNNTLDSLSNSFILGKVV